MSIDMHCHSSSKPVMKEPGYSNTRDLFDPPYLDKNVQKGFDFESEAFLINLFKKVIENQSGVFQHSQSHFDSMYKGGIRVACISLTPMEIGFNVLKQNAEGRVPLLKKIAFKRPNTKYLVNPKLVNALTGYDVDLVEKLQSSLGDYYEGLLLREYHMLMSYNNRSIQSGNLNYTIRIPANKSEFDKYAYKDNNLTLLLSIEGMHSLMKAPHIDSVFEGQQEKRKFTRGDINQEILLLIDQRVDEMKNTWAVKPLFISMMHHFWNGLGGHAPSLGRTIGAIVSQNEGMYADFNQNGIAAVLKLLKNSPIYVDIKHMSPQCRKTYYELLQFHQELKPKTGNKKFRFPVICSHTGIAPVASLQHLIDQRAKEEDIINDKGSFLFKSCINICKQEIEYIIESEGFIGIQLDEKRIAGKHVRQKLEKKYQSNMRLLYVKMLWANMFEAVRLTGIKETWDVLAIGSDYDGLINHLDPYPTSAHFVQLKQDMLQFLKSNDDIIEMDFSLTRNEINSLLFDFIDRKEELIEQIFQKNALRFIRRWMN
ncbi:MAG: hypothetical protein JNM95_13340 [Chitinophagaceae bacterium]|nr:hypothetical protein [Chitinophagaceae bacterium]